MTAGSSPLESALGFDSRLPAGGEARRNRGCLVSAGGPPTGRHGYDSSPTRTDWTGDSPTELLIAMNGASARLEAAVRRRVDVGDPNVIVMWNRTGGESETDYQ